MDVPPARDRRQPGVREARRARRPWAARCQGSQEALDFALDFAPDAPAPSQPDATRLSCLCLLSWGRGGRLCRGELGATPQGRVFGGRRGTGARHFLLKGWLRRLGRGAPGSLACLRCPALAGSALPMYILGGRGEPPPRSPAGWGGSSSPLSLGREGRGKAMKLAGRVEPAGEARRKSQGFFQGAFKERGRERGGRRGGGDGWEVPGATLAPRNPNRGQRGSLQQGQGQATPLQTETTLFSRASGYDFCCRDANPVGNPPSPPLLLPSWSRAGVAAVMKCRAAGERGEGGKALLEVLCLWLPPALSPSRVIYWRWSPGRGEGKGLSQAGGEAELPGAARLFSGTCTELLRCQTLPGCGWVASCWGTTG